jgi:hypothetical protein
MEAGDIFFPPVAPLPTAITPQSYDEHRGQETPLIIDNGSTTLRYGFCTASTPFCGSNVVAKYKERKFNRQVLLFGDAVEVESTAKAQAKSPWEGDVLLNFDALVSPYSVRVCILDVLIASILFGGEVGECSRSCFYSFGHRCRDAGPPSIDDRTLMLAIALQSM